jgi:hypothetical protein
VKSLRGRQLAGVSGHSLTRVSQDQEWCEAGVKRKTSDRRTTRLPPALKRPHPGSGVPSPGVGRGRRVRKGRLMDTDACDVQRL